MLDFVGVDRPLFNQKLTAKIVALGCALLSQERDTNVVEECDLDAVLDLVVGRAKLARVTRQADAEAIVGYLLETYQLAALPARPYVQTLVVIGTGPGLGGVVLPGQIPGLTQFVQNLINNAQSRPAVLGQNITVSLADGRTWGAIRDGELLVAGTPYDTILVRALVEAKLPTYVVPTVSLSVAGALAGGEVGETINLTFTATFARGDAGTLSGLRIQRAGVDLLVNAGTPAPGTNPTTPSVRTDILVRALAAVAYRAVASYAAGVAKPVPPANTLDARPAQVRLANAPQAADPGFASADLAFVGFHRLYFGPGIAADRAQALALNGTQITSAGNSATLLTGTSATRFTILLPPGRTLAGVTDLDNLNANLTAAYQAQAPIAIADAGGALVGGYTPYVLTAATPYQRAARHLFQFS